MPNPHNPDNLEKDPPIPPPECSCAICGGRSHEMRWAQKIWLCEECSLDLSDIGAEIFA